MGGRSLPMPGGRNRLSAEGSLSAHVRPAAEPDALPRGESIGGAIRLLKILLVASVIVPIAVFAAASWYAWLDIRSQAIEQASRTAQILREHALKVFETHELALDEIADRIRGLSWEAIEASKDLHEAFVRTTDRHDQVTSAFVVSPKGFVANTSSRKPVAGAPEVNVTDRSYFKAALEGRTGTYIGEPVVGRVTGVPVLHVARRLEAPDGGFGGIVVVAVSLEKFTSFYRGITSVQGNSVTLARIDGTILAREPPISSGAASLSPASGFMKAIVSGQKQYPTSSELDGIERIHALERVGDFAVYVSYGLSMSALYRALMGDIMVYALFAFGASASLVFVGWMALRQARNEMRLVEQWQDEVHRRESAEQVLRQTQKMEALGQLTGGVAHDFNNLLMVIGGNIELLKRKAAGAGVDRQISAIEHAAHSGEALTRKLLAFSRRRLVKATAIDLGPFLPKVVDLIKPSLPAEVDIALDVPPDIGPVKADADDLDLALVNIVLNARDAMPEGGRVVVSARQTVLRGSETTADHLAGEFVALSIRDTGAGILPQHLQRVFEPFFTTKEIGRGTGLGLSQVYGFAKQCGGAVTIDSAPGAGTTVTLYLPRAAADAAVEAERSADESPAVRKVLLVEDNKEVAEAAAAMLESIGCSVQHANASEPALALLASGERFDLVLSDIVMPGGLDGMQLARRLRAEYPSLPVLLTTGYSNSAQKAAGEHFPILLKPYRIEALQEAIGRAVGVTGRAPSPVQRAVPAN